MYIFDFIRIAREVGFRDVRISSGKRYDASNTPLTPILGDLPLYSLTLRLFKMPAVTASSGTPAADAMLIEEPAEDYGQVGI